jgi:hypothetical protein
MTVILVRDLSTEGKTDIRVSSMSKGRAEHIVWSGKGTAQIATSMGDAAELVRKALLR